MAGTTESHFREHGYKEGWKNWLFSQSTWRFLRITKWERYENTLINVSQTLMWKRTVLDTH